jgi:hypothetical protein
MKLQGERTENARTKRIHIPRRNLLNVEVVRDILQSERDRLVSP